MARPASVARVALVSATSLVKTATTQTPRRCAVIMTLWAWSSVMRNSRLQHRGDEVARREVVVDEDHLVQARPLGLGFDLGLWLGDGIDHSSAAVLTRANYDVSAAISWRGNPQAVASWMIAAADGRLDQFTGSGPVLKLGACREFQLDQGFHCAGLVQFRGFKSKVAGLIHRQFVAGNCQTNGRKAGTPVVHVQH